MQTFLTANLGLAPFTLFWVLLAFAGPSAAILAGFASSLAIVAWRVRAGAFRAMEVGGVIIFAGLGGLALIAPAFVMGAALWLSFAGLGVVALASVAIGRPWTSEYSRAAFAAEAESPIFRLVNMLISGFWGGLFLIDAAVIALHGGTLATTGLFVFGALVSVFGPKLVIRAVIARRIAAVEAYRWPAPRLGAATGDAVDVAIVGAGIGGLVAAALLADAGLKVAVFEAHVVAGGYCHTFLRKARHLGQACLYRFDAGPHDFSGVFPGGPLTRVLERLGLADRLQWRQLDHVYRNAATTIEPPRDWREYARELGRQFPEDAAGLLALFDDIRAIYDDMYATGVDKCGIPGLPGDVDAMLAYPKAHPMAFRWMERPFDELVAKHVNSIEARKVLGALTGYISDGHEMLTCADMVPIFGYYFHGGYYPLGGSGVLADALVEAIEARGGTVHLKTAVKSIAIENGRAAGVLLANGKPIAAGAVISNADIKRTFGELVDPKHAPAAFLARVGEAEPALSCFMVHLGVDYVPEGRPIVHLQDGLSIGIEVLSKVDPSAAPRGHSTVAIIKLMTHTEAKTWFPSEGGGDWKALRASADYEIRKRELGDAMIAAAETAFPGLSQHIVYRCEASPVTYARYDHASAGAIYGVAKSGRMRGVKSPIPGLVIAGAATHGPGVEAVWISGARAAAALVPGILARAPKVVPSAERIPEPA